MNAILDRVEVCEDIKFSLDWLTVCVYADNLDDFLDFFDQFLPDQGVADHWFPGRPLRFYDHSLKLNDQNIITLEYSFKKDIDERTGIVTEDRDHIEDRSEVGVNRGILLNISGDGLRYMGNDAVQRLISALDDRYGTHYTRVDLAADFFDPDNPVIPLLLDAVENSMNYAEGVPCIVSKSHSFQLFHNHDKYHKCISRSAYIGRRGGKFTRVYDKSLEQRKRAYNQDPDAFDSIPDYWYRIELEVRPCSGYEYPDTVIYNLLRGFSLQDCFLQHLKASFRVDVIKKRYNTHFNVSGCSDWDNFLLLLQQKKYFVSYVFLKYVGKSLSRFRRFQHYAPMIFTLLGTCGKDFVKDSFESYLDHMCENGARYEKYRRQYIELHGSDFDFSSLRDTDILSLRYDYNPYHSFEDVEDLSTL